MLAGPLQTWLTRHLSVRQRLERICTSYLLFLMVVTTKHSLEEAARFASVHKSLSRMLQSHSTVAIATLESLSKTQARQFFKMLQRVNGLPWKIVIIIDSTLHLHPENAKTFNHGKGYVIGHQWTNIVLILGDMLIPLRPIPFYSKRYCQAHDLAYHSEHERVVEYLRTLDLEDYVGSYDRREVLVLADSGYDNKKIEKAIADKGWNFIIALGTTRSVKSGSALSDHLQISAVVPRGHVFPSSSQAEVEHHSSGDEWEQTQAHGLSRPTHLGLFALCGQGRVGVFEQRNRPDGRRKYLACNDLRATARQIVTGYRLRWAVELFHKSVKQHLGFEDVATHGFDAVMAHVHWVYCAYILLHMSPPGLSPGVHSLGDKQRHSNKVLRTQKNGTSSRS